MSDTKITKRSTISLELVATLLAVAVSAGVLYSNVQNTKDNLTEFKTDTKAQFTSLNSKVDKLMLIVSPAVASAGSTKENP